MFSLETERRVKVTCVNHTERLILSQMLRIVPQYLVYHSRIKSYLSQWRRPEQVNKATEKFGTEQTGERRGKPQHAMKEKEIIRRKEFPAGNK